MIIAPERYHAYIAMSQMTDQLESKWTAYQLMTYRYREIHHKKMSPRMEKLKEEWEKIRNLEISIYFLAGKKDHTICYKTQKEYCDYLEAQIKELYA